MGNDLKMLVPAEERAKLHEAMDEIFGPDAVERYVAILEAAPFYAFQNAKRYEEQIAKDYLNGKCAVAQGAAEGVATAVREVGWSVSEFQSQLVTLDGEGYWDAVADGHITFEQQEAISNAMAAAEVPMVHDLTDLQGKVSKAIKAATYEANCSGKYIPALI